MSTLPGVQPQTVATKVKTQDQLQMTNFLRLKMKFMNVKTSASIYMQGEVASRVCIFKRPK